MVKLLIFTFKITKNLSLLQLFNTFLIPNSRYFRDIMGIGLADLRINAKIDFRKPCGW